MFSYPHKKAWSRVTYTILTDVAEEVVSLEEAKAFMGVDFPDFDPIILIIIKAVREEAEKYTGLSIGVRTIKLAGDYKCEDAYMPFAPAEPYNAEGIQVVGYDAETVPADLKLSLLNMIHVAFENRANGISFANSVQLLARSRRRVGL